MLEKVGQMCRSSEVLSSYLLLTEVSLPVLRVIVLLIELDHSFDELNAAQVIGVSRQKYIHEVTIVFA